MSRSLLLALALSLTTSVASAQDAAVTPADAVPADAVPADAVPADAASVEPPATEPPATEPVEPSSPPTRTIPPGEILPTSGRAPPAPPEPDPELTERDRPPPPDPEWRLRAGVGASASTSGTDVLSLRLTQEIEWMPAAAAPFLFALTGGELIGSFQLYLVGARLGGAARFCEDRIVICSGAIAIRAGAILGGGGGAQFDLGGDGDARFRFDGFELTARVGFFLVSGNAFVDAIALLGAAF